MRTVVEIRDRLLKAFPQPQADVLAGVVFEVHEQQVIRSDFNELKDAVTELAHAQNRTENRVEDLASALAQLATAQQRTEMAVANLAKQVGGLSEALGGSLEDFACDLVPELLEKYWGFVTESAGPDEIQTNGRAYPFDLVVRGTIKSRPVLVLGEVKSNVTVSEVEKFLRLVELVRASKPGEDIRAVFFGYRAERAARDLIQAKGASMVFTRGVVFPA